jgi:hypothetical protein
MCDMTRERFVNAHVWVDARGADVETGNSFSLVNGRQTESQNGVFDAAVRQKSSDDI